MTAFERIMIEADSSQDELHLSVLWRKIMTDKQFETKHKLFAREHFNFLGRKLAADYEKPTSIVLFNIFNYNEKCLY